MLKFLIKNVVLFLPEGTRRLVGDFLKQKKNCITLTKRYGQFRTIRESSCLDTMGRPIPWYTYAAIEYLSHFDFSALKVLEYGSGSSSLWWMERCQELISIENDQEWYKKIRTAACRNLNFSYVLEKREEAYVHQEEMSAANIVIIDGVYRSKCANAFIAACQDKSSELAILIFDNSDWYPKSINTLHDALGWVQVDFHGFGPINDYTWTTSVFINPKRSSVLKYAKPLMSIDWVDNSIDNADDDPQV